MSNILRFYWIRHLPINQEGVYIGQTDMPAEIPDFPANSAMMIPQGTRWFSSPMLRTTQTANWLMESYSDKKEKLNMSPELMEQNFGVWEGRSYDEVWKKEENRHDWANMASVKPEGGESFADLCKRVDGWLEKQIKQAKEKEDPEPLVVVAHAGTIRAAIRYALGITPEQALSFHMDYGSLTQMDCFASGGEFRINCVNR